jgi:hypothetical protein
LEGLRTKDVGLVSKVLKFLPQPLFQNGAYCRGPIRTKEAHCYTFDSSVGPIQIGIPPETIKTSILQGESVPKVYILPSQLFLDGRILGEIGKCQNNKKNNNKKKRKSENLMQKIMKYLNNDMFLFNFAF